MAALATAPAWYRKLFYRVEEEIRARVEANLAGRLPHLDIKLRGARLSSDGIELHGLSISEREAGPHRELAHLDEVYLTCRASPQELLSGEPVITRIRIVRPVLRATRRPDGTFSIGKLFPLPKPPYPPPVATLENGTIEVVDPLKNPSSKFVLRDVVAMFAPAADCSRQRPKLQVEAHMVADQIRRIELAGTVEPVDANWSVTGTVTDLEISPQFRASLPEPFAGRLEMLSALRAPATLNFAVARQGSGEPRYDMRGSVSRGRIEDPRLAYPLTDVQGSFHCHNAGLTLTGWTARDGPTMWDVASYTQQGHAAGSPFVLRAKGRRVHLDAKWAAALPEPWAKYWNYYNPRGDVNLDCTLVFDGQQYQPTVEATCLGNVSFSFHKFPYLFERSRGKLSMRGNQLSLSMTSHAGPQPVSIRGQFWNPGPKFTGWIELEGDKITLDDKLFAAVLERKSRETLMSLHPSGTFNVFAKLFRDDPNVRGMKKYAKVTLEPSNRCSITHDKFPYPISNLVGTATLAGEQWTFENLAGTNGPGVVNLSGSVSTAPGADGMTVTINASNVALVEDLSNALSPRMRQLWDALQPNGKLDVTASVTFNRGKARVKLRAFPRDEMTSIGTSIEPRTFPYRMRLIGGWIDYEDGHAELHKIHAAHGTTHLRTAGSCDIRPDGSWELRLRDLTVDRLRLEGEDRELAAALPAVLRHAANGLKPEGPINLTGAVEFAKQSARAPLRASWDVGLVMHQGSLQVGPKLENIFGRVRLRGSSNGPRYSSHGELELDSVTYKNFQFTEIAGPLYFDNENVYLGGLVPGGEGNQPAKRRVTAKLLGGTLAGDCHVRLGAVPQYRLVAALSKADLAQFARENLAGGQKLKGKIAAGVELRGTRGARNIYGSGAIHLSDADVYELPLMVSLLALLRAKPPDQTAFTMCDIAFDIEQGENIILKQIDLHGDAIDLSGTGELTLDQHTNPIRLRLHAAGGRGRFPLVSGMLSEASQQILLIHVRGTLDHPVARTEPFPVANQALQQFQPDPDRPSMFEPGGFMRALGLRR